MIIEKEEKFFDYKLYIDHALYHDKNLKKDIHYIGRDIKSSIIIDDNINIISNSSINNTICIKPFYGNLKNEKNTLQLLGNSLNKIRYNTEISGDIRKSIVQENYKIITEISSNLEE